MTEMTGARMVVEALKDQGVDTVFGYPGGAVLPIYDEIFQQNEIRHILVRHEQGAVHAAEGYARSTGKPGVVLVTSGPGATNAVTGLTDALMDSIPIIVLTGQVPTFMIGSDAFQEADTVAIDPAHPVQRIFQHARNALIVFGCRDHHRIRGEYLIGQHLDRGRDTRAIFQIPIVERQAQIP